MVYSRYKIYAYIPILYSCFAIEGDIAFGTGVLGENSPLNGDRILNGVCALGATAAAEDDEDDEDDDDDDGGGVLVPLACLLQALPKALHTTHLSISPPFSIVRGVLICQINITYVCVYVCMYVCMSMCMYLFIILL